MRAFAFTARQALFVGLAMLGYFGVRGLTEGNVERADRNAELVLRLERAFGLDLEVWLQKIILSSESLVDLANWIYIWGHWPVVIATLVWLAVYRRTEYFELRNAMFISGAIGLVIYASFAVTPPRLLNIDYIDTVTENSLSYRILQPPALVNKYAAVPSLHFGWNLLVAVSWLKVSSAPIGKAAAIAMPVAMGFAVVATGNHWTFDVLAGSVVALGGLAIANAYQHRHDSEASSSIEQDGQMTYG
jgi:membrane-associated phospholipid phosphatase